MKEVRTAIVGMGIGRPNGRAIAGNPRGRVVALCDLFEDRMESFAQELPAPVKLYADYVEMCRDPEIDAVFVERSGDGTSVTATLGLRGRIQVSSGNLTFLQHERIPIEEHSH